MDPMMNAYSIRSYDPAMGSFKTESKSKFARFMEGFGKAAKCAGEAFLPLIPGGNIINAALNGMSSPSNSFSDAGSGMNPYDMLNIQQQMLQESRVFTLLSNIIKIRHDSAMSAIRNIR
jgi:hypothetical protein